MAKKQIAAGLFVTVIFAGLIVFFGSAPPSPVYFIKISRETMQDFFIFGDEDRAYWLLTKAEKRISESEKLKSGNIGLFAKLQSDTAKNYQNEAKKIIDSLKDKMNTNYLIDKYNLNSDRLNNL